MIKQLHSGGFTIGGNGGGAAGETSPHAPIYDISAYVRGIAGARGRIGWVLCEKAGCRESYP